MRGTSKNGPKKKPRKPSLVAGQKGARIGIGIDRRSGHGLLRGGRHRNLMAASIREARKRFKLRGTTKTKK
jgi:hypothetical protein